MNQTVVISTLLVIGSLWALGGLILFFAGARFVASAHRRISQEYSKLFQMRDKTVERQWREALEMYREMADKSIKGHSDVLRDMLKPSVVSRVTQGSREPENRPEERFDEMMKDELNPVSDGRSPLPTLDRLAQKGASSSGIEGRESTASPLN